MKKYKTIKVYETGKHKEIIVEYYDGSPCETYSTSKIENIVNSKNLIGYYISHYGYTEQKFEREYYIMTKEID